MRIDLLYHLIAGFIISTIITTFFPIWVSIIVVLLAGIMKELYDLFITKTFFDWKDMVCTWIGGFLSIWLVLVKGNF